VILTTLEAVQLAGSVPASLPAAGTSAAGRIISRGSVLQMVEGYLLAAILIIFAFGLYELFISKIDAAEAGDRAPRTLVIRTVDDLKGRLGRVVLLALVIEFFQQSLRVDYARPIELLYMAAGILLIGVALYLSALRTGA
jgi:uncharacterized membrane protein YqhA